MGIEVKQFIWDYIDSNMYVIRHGTSALIIDPIECEEAELMLCDLNKIIILLTHEHFDHICGLNQIRKSFGCKVIAQAECSKNIQNSKKNLSAYANTLMCLTGESHKKPVSPFICESADLTFNDNFSFEWEGNTVCIFSTPGHSPGSACISIKNMLFSGDTILQSKPIYRLPGGDRAKYKSITIPKIHEILNRETIVYPGHGTIIPATSIAWL